VRYKKFGGRPCVPRVVAFWLSYFFFFFAAFFAAFFLVAMLSILPCPSCDGDCNARVAFLECIESLKNDVKKKVK
jgi:hypothetical protein